MPVTVIQLDSFTARVLGSCGASAGGGKVQAGPGFVGRFGAAGTHQECRPPEGT